MFNCYFLDEIISYGKTTEMDSKICFERPKVRIATNECIEIVDNSIVFNSTTKYVKEITEYAITNDEQAEPLDNVLVTEQKEHQHAQIEPLNTDKLIVTEYVPQLREYEKQTVQTPDNEDGEEEIEKVVVKTKNFPDLQSEESIETDESQCLIEDVSNVAIEDTGLKTEPIISLFKEEKIIKIHVENDNIEISEIKDDVEATLEEVKHMKMQIDTSEVENGKQYSYIFIKLTNLF